MPRFRALAAILAVVLLGTASNQCLSRADVYAMIGSGFSWKSTAQSSWATDHTMVTWSDFTNFINNNGGCTQPGGLPNGLMNFSQMQACAVNSSVHTPILANHSFAGASFASWTDDAYTACGTSSNFGAISPPAQDGDGGSASASSSATLSCTGATSVGMSQTFTITGSSPTSQSLSFYYQAPYVIAGDPVNCSQGMGSAGITVKVNGTTVATVSSPTYDSNWHAISTPIGSLVTGSNTIDITASVMEAQGTTGSPTCTTHQFAAQNVYIDNVVLTATY